MSIQNINLSLGLKSPEYLLLRVLVYVKLGERSNIEGICANVNRLLTKIKSNSKPCDSNYFEKYEVMDILDNIMQCWPYSYNLVYPIEGTEEKYFYFENKFSSTTKYGRRRIRLLNYLIRETIRLVKEKHPSAKL
jgi:hypothetical protein